MQQLNGKADKLELDLLYNNIQNHCDNLAKQAKALSAFLDHGSADFVSRQIIRDANCVSCRTLPMEYPVKVKKGEISKITTACKTGTENALSLKGVIHIRPCYPGELIKHALDPR